MVREENLRKKGKYLEKSITDHMSLLHNDTESGMLSEGFPRKKGGEGGVRKKGERKKEKKRKKKKRKKKKKKKKRKEKKKKKRKETSKEKERWDVQGQPSRIFEGHAP